MGTAADMPVGLSNQQVTVVVQLAKEPVTVADSNAGNNWNDGQKQSWKSQLRSEQAPVADKIRSLGGEVLAQYQSAYNGIKVLATQAEATQMTSIPGVVAVHPLLSAKIDNTHGVPLIGGPAVWGGVPGLAGEHMKVAVIDTGVDYTHADFGGSGNVADYNTALASDTLPANAAWFGPTAPKVKGGYDFVGDNYNADTSSSSYQPIPHPDPNPLDCHGHGTHTAGTATGFGVLANGTTYNGSYDATTISSNAWNVGPGVAPKADLYALRVFGCSGSTDVVIDAIEWAVDHDMDVINMSLGSLFGGPDSPDAVASTNAAKSGVIVITSAGNSGSAAYITGAPGTGSGVIANAASDPTQEFPGANLTLTKADATSGGLRPAIVINGLSPLPTGPMNVKVIRTATGAISQGCSTAAFGVVPANTLVVIARGFCARVAKAINAEKAGAAAAVMVNNASSFPPFEGKITHNPDAPGPPLFGGENFTVTIPYFGVRGANPPTGSAAGQQFIAADGGTVTIAPAAIANPGFLAFASFSSWGPASGDSSLKPNVTAPGVSIASAGMGTGSEAAIMSGTSMASPHTAGMAALVKQAHPDWRKVKYWAAAIQNTADPGQVNGYTTRGGGTGLVQAVPATQTQVVALGGKDNGTLNFGFNELSRDFNKTLSVTLKNFGSSPATFDVAQALPQGLAHTVAISPSSVTVPGRSERDVRVTLSVPLAAFGGSSGAAILVASQPFVDVAGLVTFTPAGGSNNGVTLRVPYYLVPQAVSQVSTKLRLSSSGLSATTTNRGAIAGIADWYAFGIKDKKDKGVGASNDIRAVGASSYPDPATSPYGDSVLTFAISTYGRWSNPSMNEWDIRVDTNNDGTYDYTVVVADLGAVTNAGAFNGLTAVFVFARGSNVFSLEFGADAATDSSTMTVPVLFSQLGLTAANPRFTYWVDSFGLTDNTSDTTAKARFNAFSPAVSTGMYDSIAPGASVNEPLSVNLAELVQTPALGWMVVTHENAAGKAEAQLIGAKGNDDNDDNGQNDNNNQGGEH